MYGNTAAIGEAIAASLAGRGLDVRAGRIDQIEPGDAADVDLLVVGGPTHAHGMSWTGTRRAAVKDRKNTYTSAAVDPGLREWMDGLDPGNGRRAAAFDTRFHKSVILTGSAARAIGRRLRRHGFRLAVQPECFLVSSQNHLVDRQIEHATTWAGLIADEAGTLAA